MRGTIQSFRRKLLAFYDRNRRDLPWRPSRDAPTGTLPDPYFVLVSEAMLQQTQVATVVPFFQRFLARFPTLFALAEAGEQEVLRLWQGLGYYSRARNLHRSAKAIVRDFDGHIPKDAQLLRTLSGVGRYTAGAIASIAFDAREPIVDGNVARVLCRIDWVKSDPREPNARELLWQRARELLPVQRVGDFNSALMELGATVCTPRAPKCPLCPARRHCEAFNAGVQDSIPLPRKAKPTPLLKRRTICIRRVESGVEKWLLEQRPDAGRWAAMWQFVTRPNDRSICTRIPNGRTRRVCRIAHALTHMRYEFDVCVVDVRSNGASRAIERLLDRDRPIVWTTLDGLDNYPLPRPHARIAEILRANEIGAR